MPFIIKHPLRYPGFISVGMQTILVFKCEKGMNNTYIGVKVWSGQYEWTDF